MKRSLCAILALLILCSALSGAALAAPQTQTLRVGFFAFDGYHMQDESGIRSGYGYELLQHLAGYAGFQYEYVGYDKSWSEIQDMLERGEIDLLTSAQKTPEREARFDFSTSNVGISSAILTVKAGDTRFLPGDPSGWSGLRVGMLDGNSRNDNFANYAQTQGFTYSSVYFPSTAALTEALQAGERIDAILTSSLRRTDGEQLLAQFDSSPFFIMVQKGNTALLQKVDAAIAQLDQCEPGLRTRLMNQYYAPVDTGLVFTPEERAYIEEMRGVTLTALINPDRAPFSWYKDGKLTGIAYDAAMEIFSRTGLNIQFAALTNPADYYARVDAGAFDLRVEIASSYSQAETEHCWLTAPFLTVTMARLHRKDVEQVSSAAEPEHRDIADNYASLMSSMRLITKYYPTLAQTADAVLSGEADLSDLPIDTARWLVKNDVTNRLEADEIFGNETSYAIEISTAQSSLLYSIVSKASASLDAPVLYAIRQAYASEFEKSLTLIGYLYEYPMHVVILVLGACCIALMTLRLVRNAKRRKQTQAQMVEERRRSDLLADALDVAEKANAAKGQFLSRVSHEMRTPLNAIIGFIELSAGAAPAEAAAYLANSELAAKQLLNVINDVLDMSSIESGKLKISSASFNFKRLLTSLTSIYGAQCKQKGVSFEVRMKSVSEDFIVGDELRLNQILNNLLGNAVKFTAAGRIWLTVSQTSVEEEKLFYRFEISDTGCGMSEELQSRLFKPFEQESASTAKKYGGSGLGLSIVKNLVGMMGGTITVESTQEHGSTFVVDLPFSRSRDSVAAIAPEDIGRLRVLSVDDDPAEQEYLSAVLNRMNVRFTCVSGGAAALQALDAAAAVDPFNVCIIDWRMPGMNGEETTRQIRERYGEDLLVIIISAYEFQQAGDRARKAGANFFVSKPIFQSSLFDLFMRLTGGKLAALPKRESIAWDFTGRRVLLAEDNKLNQIVAQAYLKKDHVAVELAENGEQAVELFCASAPGYYDAILMDIQMPELDGFAATRAIRTCGHPQAKTIQIIAQTADAFDEDVAKALSCGMNAHVAKPIKPELLAKALAKAFEKTRREEEQKL